MANENGRIFVTAEGGVTYGVEIADLQQVLGRSVNDLGLLCSDKEWNSEGTELQDVDNINKWAKYRPIEKRNFLGVLTDAQRRAEDWGIGNIPIWTNKTIPQMVKFWVGGSGSSGSTPPDCGIQYHYWTKVLPSTYYRLRDFSSDVNNKGYFHGAQAPISQFVGDLAIPSTAQLDVIYPRGAESAETLLLSDIGNFSSYYFGVIFANADFSLIYIKTQDYPMGSSSWTQDFTVHIPGAADLLVPLPASSATWRVFPVFCNALFSTLTDVHSSIVECTTVALLDYTEEVITRNGVNYRFVANNARRDNGSKKVSYSFQFINDETTTGLTDVRVVVEYKTSLGEVVATGINNVGSVQASESVEVEGDHQFTTVGIAASIYSVVAHVDQITGRDFTVKWAEAVVNEISRD